MYGHNLVNQVKHQMKKEKVIVFQPFGSGVKIDGNFVFDESGRSFELKDVFEIVDELSKDYAVILMTNLKIPTDRQMGAAIPEGANLLQWMGIVNAADYFLGCDSMGQHYAHALGKPATVVIGSTFPENISYPNNNDFTIIDSGKENRVYVPYRVTTDPAAERHNEDNMILSEVNYKKIMKSINNKLGKPTSQSSQIPLAKHASNVLFNKPNKKVIGEK
jgi:ADP-heptose:LPS heptosyltransferase